MSESYGPRVLPKNDIHGPSYTSQGGKGETKGLHNATETHPVRPFFSLSLVIRTPIMPFETRFFFLS